MAQKHEAVKQGYSGYPRAEEGPKTEYQFVPGDNPVLRGFALDILSRIISNVSQLANFLWSNAGFPLLRNIKELDNQQVRYEPAVIPNSSISDPKQVDLHTLLKSSSGDGRHFSADNYHAAFKKGSLTPTVVASTILESISSTPKHKAGFLEIKPSLVLAAAEASTARWKAGNPLSALDGVPVAIKDEVDIEGYKKTLATGLDLTPDPNVTSWCVAQWEAAGAIIIGKTNMHQLGMDVSGNNGDNNTPLNPHNSQYYCGGSSSGSAYVVAAGLVPISLGVDAGGSIRIPSSYCGIYGLKPTFGRVSRLPTPNICTSTSSVGPMASSMSDIEIAYRIMATPNPSDPNSSQFPIPAPFPSPSPTQKRIIGIYDPHFTSADPDVLTACNATLAHYKSLGYTVQPIHIPYISPHGRLAHALTCLSEITSATREPFSQYTASNRILLAIGRQTPATDFMLAQRLRNLLMQHLAFLWKEHPGMLIVTPTTANAGWFIDGGASELKGGINNANMGLKSMGFIWLANFTGCPALTVPVGKVEGKGGEGKLPVGMMAMGEWGDEEGLIGWGRDGEEWCWEAEGGGMTKPGNWVDVFEDAGSNMVGGGGGE